MGTTDQHPDFSATGAPIQFGFFRANTTTNAEYSITSGIDNWSVSINPAASGSETAGFLWLVIAGVGLGLALLIAWKQRQPVDRPRKG